jgi:hypothetical protein
MQWSPDESMIANGDILGLSTTVFPEKYSATLLRLGKS